MIYHITHKNINFEKWDRCVSDSISDIIYAKSWYLNIVCEKWDAIVLNDYEAVMPLPKKNILGLKYITQPFMCQQLGVFHQQEDFCIDDFISIIPKIFLRFTINLNLNNTVSSSILKKNVNYTLLLNKNIHDLRSNYSKSHLKNLRRAHIKKVSVSSVPDTPEEFSFNKRKLSSNFMSKKQLDIELKIINVLIGAGKGEIFSAKVTNDNCCSIFVANENKRLYLLSSYSNEEGRANSVYFFLIDHIFSLKKFRGYIFDFEGSNIKGIAERNKGFGAKPSNYVTIHQSLFKRCINCISKKQ